MRRDVRQDGPALTDTDAVQASRRQLLADSAGIAVSAVGFGFVYGLSARETGFSPIEVFPTLWGEGNPCLLMAKPLP